VRLASLLWSSGSIVAAVADASFTLTDVNPTLERWMGRDPRGEPVGTLVTPDQAAAFGAWIVGVGDAWETRTWGALAGDDGAVTDLRVAACRASDDALVVIGEPPASDDLSSALRDVNESLVTEQRRLGREQMRLGREAQQDALTGLANRRAFDARLADEVTVAERTARTFALVMLDIDHFKALNDRYGHVHGDSVLRWLGALLASAARRGDLVARYGGEEFAAILPDAGVDDAGRWAERLRQSISADPPPGTDTTVTVSMGVAAWRAGDAPTDTVARADRALYAAKDAGRDRVAIDGVVAGPSARPSPEMPSPLWTAGSLGVAVVDDGIVQRANPALAHMLGRHADGLHVGELVHEDQAPAFTAFVDAAEPDWRKAIFGVAPDARGIPVDLVVWTRRRADTVELLFEPAAEEQSAVEGALLTLVDDLIDLQRELVHRTSALERALAEKSTAERRASDLERLVPVCVWCGRTRPDTAAARWTRPAVFAKGVVAAPGLCDECERIMSSESADRPRMSPLHPVSE
jgi:diguanylate cyclase (GGDEF)-like protein